MSSIITSSYSAQQIKTVKVSDLQALTASDINQIAPEAMAGLTPTQMKALPTSVISQISTDQLSYLSPTQLASLNTSQMRQ